jgi:glycerol-3-phosphate cytidylyltransferase
MSKRIIGYTTGVFDLFHIGHLNILRQAKEQCDHLIVGVSTDDLVFQYKHFHPVIPFSERVEIVKSIRYVDEVVPQTTRDKLEAFRELHFDVMFVGDDWKGSALFTEVQRELELFGARLVYFPYTSGTSSTTLRNALANLTTRSVVGQ